VDASAKAARQAKSKEERAEALRQRPSPAEFAPRFLTLAEKYPKAPAAVDALAWVVNNTNARNKSGPRDKAIHLLVHDHLKSDKLAPLCAGLSRGYDTASRDALRAILDKSPHVNVKAAACMALGTQYQNRAQLAGRLNSPALVEQAETNFGKAAVEEMKRKGEAGLNKEAEALLERVVKEFPDAKDARGNRLGPLAEGKLLGPGRAALEIAGEDTDGKKF
jgi:hypothetical protein